MNNLIIIGNLTRDPELKVANTKAGQIDVCTFTVAVNERNSENATFVNVTVWRGMARPCSTFLNKGSKVMVSGAVHLRTYTKSDGSQGASLELTANEVEFLNSKNERPATPAPAPAPVPVEMPDLPF